MRIDEVWDGIYEKFHNGVGWCHEAVAHGANWCNNNRLPTATTVTVVALPVLGKRYPVATGVVCSAFPLVLFSNKEYVTEKDFGLALLKTSVGIYIAVLCAKKSSFFKLLGSSLLDSLVDIVDKLRGGVKLMNMPNLVFHLVCTFLLLDVLEKYVKLNKNIGQYKEFLVKANPLIEKILVGDVGGWVTSLAESLKGSTYRCQLLRINGMRTYLPEIIQSFAEVGPICGLFDSVADWTRSHASYWFPTFFSPPIDKGYKKDLTQRMITVLGDDMSANQINDLVNNLQEGKIPEEVVAFAINNIETQLPVSGFVDQCPISGKVPDDPCFLKDNGTPLVVYDRLSLVDWLQSDHSPDEKIPGGTRRARDVTVTEIQEGTEIKKLRRDFLYGYVEDGKRFPGLIEILGEVRAFREGFPLKNLITGINNFRG